MDCAKVIEVVQKPKTLQEAIISTMDYVIVPVSPVEDKPISISWGEPTPPKDRQINLSALNRTNPFEFAKSKLCKIPLRNKDLAFGYVKEFEAKNSKTICEMVKYLCLMHLNPTKDEIDLELNRGPSNPFTNGRLWGIKFFNTNEYFTNKARTGIHEWILQIKQPNKNRVCIGIVDSDLTEYPKSGFCDKSKDGNDIGYEFDLEAYGDDHTFKMILNMNKLTLSLNVSDTDYERKVIDIKKGKYRAVISAHLMHDVCLADICVLLSSKDILMID